MKIFTIGFTKTTAEHFFSRLQSAGPGKLIDVRLKNVSQLAGFAKRDDLKYFVRQICGIKYEHMPELAPTQEMLDRYKKQGGRWEDYSKKFMALMAERHIDQLDQMRFNGACLLCSEDLAHHCHRRLVAEYLNAKWQNVEICHL
jgi:uncharacterized protein (DUF488 family)